MPKQKQFLKDMKDSKKKGKHATAAPQTAEEYLEQGVDFEEAGEKWRAGDAAKSTRFFVRAIECYDAGLKKFPTSFDLAYNKARIQYQLTQHPKLFAHIPGQEQLPPTLLGLLYLALDSSRFALKLKEDNAECLFNTAQVLTSLAEAINESQSDESDPLPVLEEALELFQRCLALQEHELSASTAQHDNIEQESAMDVDVEEGGVPLSRPPAPQEEQWATIVEPVTNDILVDTIVAQLECLTTFSSLIPFEASNVLIWIEQYSTPLLNAKLPTYLNGSDREAEAGHARANFLSTIAEAAFRCQRIDTPTYYGALNDAFATIDLDNDQTGLVNKAEALIAYNFAVFQNYNPKSNIDTLESRWKALSTAIKCLTAASKLPAVNSLAPIHLARGDVELLRYQLGQGQDAYDVAAKAGSVLVANAEKFYRGAGAIAKAEGDEKIAMIAHVKEVLAATFGGKEALAAIALSGHSSNLQDCNKEELEVLEEAIQEGLVTSEQLTRYAQLYDVLHRLRAIILSDG